MPSIEIEIDGAALRQVDKAINSLMNRRAMDMYGRIVRRNTRGRMASEIDVSGRPFTPLSQSYLETKKGDGILRETGDLFRSIFVEARSGEASIGTRLPRGTWHQNGAPERGEPVLPQREWLGVTPEDISDLDERAHKLWDGAF